MAKYTLTVPEIKAELVNSAFAADSELWPVWITDVVETEEGNYLVYTADNGVFEIVPDNYVVVGAAGTSPIQIDPTTLTAMYTEVIEE